MVKFWFLEKSCLEVLSYVYWKNITQDLKIESFWDWNDDEYELSIWKKSINNDLCWERNKILDKNPSTSR